MYYDHYYADMPSKRWIDYSGTDSNNSDLFTRKGKEYLYSLEISGVKNCLDTIDFLDKKIQEMLGI
jgi:hypothetical protein